MPRIIVEADGSAGEVVFQERVRAECLASDHYSTQLIERVAWAVADAERAEGNQRRRITAGATVPGGDEPDSGQAPDVDGDAVRGLAVIGGGTR